MVVDATSRIPCGSGNMAHSDTKLLMNPRTVPGEWMGLSFLKTSALIKLRFSCMWILLWTRCHLRRLDSWRQRSSRSAKRVTRTEQHHLSEFGVLETPTLYERDRAWVPFHEFRLRGCAGRTAATSSAIHLEMASPS